MRWPTEPFPAEAWHHVIHVTMRRRESRAYSNFNKINLPNHRKKRHLRGVSSADRACGDSFHVEFKKPVPQSFPDLLDKMSIYAGVMTS